MCVEVCVCVRATESNSALRSVKVDVWRWRTVGESGGRRVPEGDRRFIARRRGDTSWAGTNWFEINFPVGYRDPRALPHIRGSATSEGPRHVLKVIIPSSTARRPLHSDEEKNSTLPGRGIRL